MLAGVSSGCAGHAEVTYRGAVVSGDPTRHQFASAPAQGEAVAGALVDLVLVLDGSDLHCTAAETREKPSDTATVGPDGRYEVSTVFGSMLGTPDKILLVCVRHPDYELAEYRTVFENTPRPEKDGSQFLNFYLRKR